ncbi:MAG: hypothetical protein WCV41_02065 [Patescibacteria group bacterium]
MDEINKACVIEKEDREPVAKVIRKIIFYLREGKGEAETAVKQTLEESHCIGTKTEEIIQGFLGKCKQIKDRNRQIVFWGDALVIVTRG